VKFGRQMLIASKRLKVRNSKFKFGTHARRECPVMTPENFFVKGAWPGSRDPVNFWALNANSSKTVEDTNFKFGTRASVESPVITTEKFVRKGGVARVK